MTEQNARSKSWKSVCVKWKKQVAATARLAMQTSTDFAEHRAALQGLFFLAGAAKQNCLEVYEAYSRDRG